jgi:hypothetical protein
MKAAVPWLVDTRKLVTHCFPLSDLAKAAEFLDAHAGQDCHIALTS